jgi:outer membrane lipopolysaccharide assembly protein LptE/RlpB
VRRRTLVALAVAALIGGCGYSTQGTLPSDIKTIAVPIFQNLTREPAVEGVITRGVVEAFSTNGRLKIASVANADAILDGEVIGYNVFSIAFDRNSNVRQYRLIVTVNLLLRDRRKNEVLFRQTGVREQVDFRVENAVSGTISLEETALKAAAVEVGRTIASLTVARF